MSPSARVRYVERRSRLHAAELIYEHGREKRTCGVYWPRDLNVRTSLARSGVKSAALHTPNSTSRRGGDAAATRRRRVDAARDQSRHRRGGIARASPPRRRRSRTGPVDVARSRRHRSDLFRPALRRSRWHRGALVRPDATVAVAGIPTVAISSGRLCYSVAPPRRRPNVDAPTRRFAHLTAPDGGILAIGGGKITEADVFGKGKKPGFPPILFHICAIAGVAHFVLSALAISAAAMGPPALKKVVVFIYFSRGAASHTRRGGCRGPERRRATADPEAPRRGIDAVRAGGSRPSRRCSTRIPGRDRRLRPSWKCRCHWWWQR